MYELMKFDTFLSAQQAVDLGLADKIVEKRG
jgi:ATP-dependent protease ClpP protease subunit